MSAGLVFLGWKTPSGELFQTIYVNEGATPPLKKAYTPGTYSGQEGYTEERPGQHEGDRVRSLLGIRRVYPKYNRTGVRR